MKRLAIFASGRGSNARAIIRHFDDNPSIEVALVLSNNADAGVLNLAREAAISTEVLDREAFYHSKTILQTLEERSIDFIVLAGFLWLIPDYLIQAFPRAILNIHPALLPAYGGKGMYGMNVHRAVFEAREKESGITIHLIDEEYDKGEIVFQASCDVSDAENAEEIAKRVLQLEHQHFAQVIENVLLRGTSEKTLGPK